MTLSTKTENRFNVISLFTGAGGLDIGFEQAGFNTISAVEIVPQYAETIRVNQAKGIKIPNTDLTYFHNTIVLNQDITNVTANDLNPQELDIDCVIGGPPCQAFSSAGHQDSIFDQRGALIYQYLRVIRELRPKTFLFENVRGLVTAKGQTGEPGEVLLGLLSLMTEEGYNCRVTVLNSADYGSYQRRVRCFIIGSRIGVPPEFPAPTHAERASDSLFEPCRLPWNTLGEFLDKYSDDDQNHWVRPTETLYKELKDIREGSGLKSPGRAEATRPSGHWGYRQGTFIADKSKPARTVTGSSSQDWIRLADGSLRRLTLKEVALLQGFPELWTFCGSKASQYQQIGNAVPIVFGKVLGEILRQYLLSDKQNQVVSEKLYISPLITQSIRYTKYDNDKNGSYRVNRLSRHLGTT